MRHYGFLLAAALLSACVEDAQTNHPPVLDEIGPYVISAGTPFQLTLTANHPDGNSLSFASDGAVGPNANPYTPSSAAQFFPLSALFTWTPTSAEIGDYSVEFRVSETDTPDLSSDSEVVTLRVVAPENYGQALFETHCASCHGKTAGGATSKGVRGASAPEILTTLQNVDVMRTLAPKISENEAVAIAETLALFAQTYGSHDDFDPAVRCMTCHDGQTATGQSATHLPTTNDCAACHTTAAWKLTQFDHANILSGCVTCHNGILVIGKPGVHATTTDVCEACHSPEKFYPVIQVDHSQVMPNKCYECHPPIALAR